MKIALFTDTWHPQVNGVVSYLDSILPHIAKGNEVILFAPGDCKMIESVRGRDGVKTYWIPASPFPYYEGYRMSGMYAHQISQILKRERPDVVHAHAPVLLGLQGLLAAKRRGIPVLATYHTHLPDYLPYLLDGKFPGFVKRLGRTTVKGLIRFVFSLTDSTIAPTDELAKELRAYGVRNVIVIPNGIDLGRLKATEAQKARFMRRYRMPAGRKVVLYVGRLGFEKRLDVLLAALPKLKARGWFLLVVGSGPQQEGYLREAEALGLARNARFTGMVSGEELCAAYACADVFASASDSETFGLTFIEAMSFGVPAVGVDKLGPREIIRDGVNGFLVKPGDSAAMAKRMDMLLSDGKLRKRLGAQAKATAGRFTIESSAEATLQAYREVVGAKGRKHGWKRLIPAMEWTPGRCMPGSQ
jgi:glycosyltransferase involved in cell wall biosynthesis